MERPRPVPKPRLLTLLRQSHKPSIDELTKRLHGLYTPKLPEPSKPKLSASAENTGTEKASEKQGLKAAFPDTRPQACPYTQPQTEFAYTQPQTEFAYTQPQTEFAYTQQQTEFPYTQPQTEFPYTQPQTEFPYTQPQTVYQYTRPQTVYPYTRLQYTRPQTACPYPRSQTAFPDTRSQTTFPNRRLRLQERSKDYEVRRQQLGMTRVVADTKDKLVEKMQEESGRQKRQTYLFPKYWKIRKQGVCEDADDCRNFHNSTLQPVTGEERAAVEQLVYATWDRRFVGAGRDGINLTHCSIRINEHYLFHGYKIEFKDAIIRDGLDFRMASDRSMLGRGIYAAESATKSDQYTDSRHSRSSKIKAVILLRSLLGEPYINTALNPPKFSRPPCMACGQEKCTCPNSTQYDCVIDDAGRNFREFVFYDHNLCYPEYFITYERV